MTITAVRPQRSIVGGETSSEVTSPLLLATAWTPAAAQAGHGPGVGHSAAPVPGSRAAWFVPVLAAVVVAALVSTGVGAYLLGAHAGDRAAASAPTRGPASDTALSAAPASIDGPRLLDTSGSPVDAGVAEHVRAVYVALQSADLAAVKRSYSASGSDDWLTVKSKLDRASVRAALLEAMRTAPSRRSVEYRYRAAGYGLTFQQSGSLPAGLVLITGPWSSSSSDRSSADSSAASPAGSSAGKRSTSSSRSTSTPRSSSTASASSGNGSCAAGTTATSTQDYPCRDNATGKGVYRDGTVGVHGLKPCPAGTVVPSDPNEPTRNSTTGAMCAYDPTG